MSLQMYQGLLLLLYLLIVGVLVGVTLKVAINRQREIELHQYDLEELKQRHEDYRTKLRLEQQSKIDAIWVNNDR